MYRGCTVDIIFQPIQIILVYLILIFYFYSCLRPSHILMVQLSQLHIIIIILSIKRCGARASQITVLSFHTRTTIENDYIVHTCIPFCLHSIPSPRTIRTYRQNIVNSVYVIAFYRFQFRPFIFYRCYLIFFICVFLSFVIIVQKYTHIIAPSTRTNRNRVCMFNLTANTIVVIAATASQPSREVSKKRIFLFL